jgi:acetolactate synthase I/II/III large subunit
MDGASALLGTLAAAGVEVCFANPGTTELALVRGLDAAPGIRPVLGLFEGVCTGAADGYGRMTGRPALTLLHLGPGLANGLANLHNARRARTPVLNLVGDHASWHRDVDAPLTSDIESLAWPVSAWVRTTAAAGELVADGLAALAAARTGAVATLIVPADFPEADAPAPTAPTPSVAVSSDVALATDDDVDAAIGALTSAPTVLLLGGVGLSAAGLRAAGRIAAATGARLVAETFPARMERGGGLPAPARLPYVPELATAELAEAAALVLAGARSPVSFFGYPGLPSSTVPAGTAVVCLATAEQDVVGALEAVADRCGAAPEAPGAPPRSTLAAPTGNEPLTPATVGAVLAALQPDGAVVVDESVTTGFPYWALAAGAPAHSYLSLTGGSIGQGLPCATGAAIACPDRRVVAFQADGSGLYTLQALWTQARESLDVVTLICANRSYRILRAELARAGVPQPTGAAAALTDLSRPDLDWVALAAGMGVPGERVRTPDELSVALALALAEPGPRLVEMVL